MPIRARTLLLAACLLVLACALPVASHASSGGSGSYQSGTGGVGPDDPQFAPTPKARLVNGIAIPPAGAPPQVVAVIRAANQIVHKPYRLGGGHGSFRDSAYDCSGSVSFALHGAGFVTSPLDSSDFASWGAPGRGRWMTVYTNPAHAFLVIAGLRFDTGFRDAFAASHGAAPGTGPRWGKPRPTRGYTARHPSGF